MNFPKHNIDPRRKDKQWHLQFCKAAWDDNENNLPSRMFHKYALRYDEIKQYAMGSQSVSKYKKAMGIDEKDNDTWLNVDFSVFPVVKTHRQIALGKLQKSDYNIVATPIDPQARDEADKYFADVKAKIIIRDQMRKMNPELLESPALKGEPGEPEDLEELEMQMNYGFRHNMAMEAEMGIQLVFNQNEMERIANLLDEDFFDYGVAVMKDSLDENGKAILRRVDVRSFLCNYCRYEDFRDLLYAGELVDMTVHNLRQEAGTQFTDQEYLEIIDKARMQSGNPKSTMVSQGKGWDKHKIKVLDLEWFTTDEIVFEDRVDRRNNRRFGRARYTDENVQKDKIKRKAFKMVYRAKWIVGTDFIYDWGKATDMKRAKSNLAETSLSYHIVAANFYEMTAKGVMEDLIPIADQCQIAWLKLQNIRNSLLPFLIELDLDALEGVALGKGGEAMSPKDLLAFMFQTGILATRRQGIAQNNINYKPIEYVQTNYGQAIGEAWNDLMNNISQIQRLTGFNELTNGETPNPKILTTPAKMAYEATDNALYQLVYAKRCLLLKTAKAAMQRLQQAVKRGQVSGYIKALGSNTVKFIQVSPDINLHEYGIVLDDKPTAEEKMKLLQYVVESIAKGELDMVDAIMIENTQNVKQAQELLAHRIKKTRERLQQDAMQREQMNGQIQIQSAQAAKQAEIEKLQIEWALKTAYMEKDNEWKLKIKTLELAAKNKINEDNLDVQENAAIA